MAGDDDEASGSEEQQNESEDDLSDWEERLISADEHVGHV